MGLIYSDIPELEGSNTEISLANLSELEWSLEAIIEERLAHLTELSEAIVSDGEDEDIIKSIILSIKSDGKADSGNILSENRHVSDMIFKKLSTVERLAVFKEIFGKLGDDNSTFEKLSLNLDIKIPDVALDRIAYIKNSYNDVAYMQFSSLLSSPRAAYYGNITDVCENVFKGVCEFCVLPVETSSDGKMLSFYELIFKYELKIVAVYDLQNKNGYTRYALLARRLISSAFPVKAKARTRYLEIAIPRDEMDIFEDIFSAANFCSLNLHRIDTMNLRNENDNIEDYICFVFRAECADLHTFLSYLAIDYPDFIPIGFYNQI